MKRCLPPAGCAGGSLHPDGTCALPLSGKIVYNIRRGGCPIHLIPHIHGIEEVFGYGGFCIPSSVWRAGARGVPCIRAGACARASGVFFLGLPGAGPAVLPKDLAGQPAAQAGQPHAFGKDGRAVRRLCACCALSDRRRARDRSRLFLRLSLPLRTGQRGASLCLLPAGADPFGRCKTVRLGGALPDRERHRLPAVRAGASRASDRIRPGGALCPRAGRKGRAVRAAARGAAKGVCGACAGARPAPLV